MNVVISARPTWGVALAHYLSSDCTERWQYLPRAEPSAPLAHAIIDAVQLPDAFRVLRQFAAQFPSTRVVAVFARPSDFVASRARDAGCRAVLSDVDDLPSWLQILERLPSAEFQSGPSFARAPRFCRLLTPRQAAVYDAVSRGLSDEQIAQAFGISIATAETHRRDIQQKLGCHGHAEVVSHALRHGVVDVADLRTSVPVRQATRRHCAAGG